MAAELRSHHITLSGSRIAIALCSLETVINPEEETLSAIPQLMYNNMFDLILQQQYYPYRINVFLIYSTHLFVFLSQQEDISKPLNNEDIVAFFTKLHEQICDLLNIRFSILIKTIEHGLYELHANMQLLLERHLHFHSSSSNSIFYLNQLDASGDRREITQAIEYVKTNIGLQSLSLHMVASHVSLSDAYFSKIFSEIMNEPFRKYLIRLRIDHAKNLLENTDCKLYDIALQSGFTDDTYFSRVFKKNTGISPSEWRILCRTKI